jgi:hypothetical protein
MEGHLKRLLDAVVVGQQERGYRAEIITNPKRSFELFPRFQCRVTTEMVRDLQVGLMYMYA